MIMKANKVRDAYERSKPGRDALRAIDAQCMEVTEDKAGIVWERYLVVTSAPLAVHQTFVNVVLFSTPHWWDVFVPVTSDNAVASTVDAIKALSVQKPTA